MDSTETTAAPPFTLEDVEEARERLAPHVPKTPLLRYPGLSRELSADVWLKHENHHGIGSFKMRGALNAVLAASNGVAGVVACTAGNHGQGVAYAANVISVPATLVVPVWANPLKVRALEALGAEVVVHGTTASQADAKAREIAADRGFMLVGDNPLVMAGHATIALELLEQRPELDTIVLPVGGGALAVGCGLTAKWRKPDVSIVGVQAAACPAAHHSWKAGEPVTTVCDTIADGLAVDRPSAAATAAMLQAIDKFALVSEDQLLEGIRTLVVFAHTLAEPSGAAPVAAVREDPSLAGGCTALVVTGANVREDVLRRALRAGEGDDRA